jgi:glutamate transport system substrate-binding protein
VTSHFLGNITLVEAAASDWSPRYNSEVDAVTTDDVILAGFAAQPQYLANPRGEGLLRRLRVGCEGNTALVDKVNAALKQYITTAPAKSLDANVGLGLRIPDPPTVASA